MEIKLVYKRKAKLHHYLDFFAKDNGGFTLYWATIKDGFVTGGKVREIQEIGNSETMLEYKLSPEQLPQELTDFMYKVWQIEKMKARKSA